MKTRIIFGLLALISLSSCSRILMSLAGMKPPKEETPASVNEFARKIGLNEKTIWIIKDSVSYLNISRPGNDTLFADLRGSDMCVFNNKGEYMPYQDPKYTCPAPSFVIANNMCTYTPFETKKHVKLQDYLVFFKSLNGDDFTIDDIEKFDYIVVMSWLIFAGETNNKEHVVDIQNRLANTKNCNVKFITPNLDFQKSWNFGKPKVSINSHKAKSNKK